MVRFVVSWIPSDFYSCECNRYCILKLFLRYCSTFQAIGIFGLSALFYDPKMAYVYQCENVFSQCPWYDDPLFLEQQAFCFSELVLYVPVRYDAWIYPSLVMLLGNCVL